MAVLIGAVLTALVRQRPGLAWIVAVTTMVIGSPVLNMNTFTLLLAGLAPFPWPVRPDSAVPVTRAERAMDISTVG